MSIKFHRLEEYMKGSGIFRKCENFQSMYHVEIIAYVWFILSEILDI